MHFSNFLFVSALTLAPAVYSYGLAEVEITYHEACSNGEPPHNPVEHPESTIASKDICSQLPPKHSFDIDAYAFKATPLTEDTTYTCHAVGIYRNTKCWGNAATVIPLFPGEKIGKTPCVKDVYWEDGLSVKLLCEDEHKHGNKHEDRKADIPEIDELNAEE
ncbi:hypothetical protein BDV18DRAFT_159816 [Aspergillus unguis]